jgi:hypothetical protein
MNTGNTRSARIGITPPLRRHHRRRTGSAGSAPAGRPYPVIDAACRRCSVHHCTASATAPGARRPAAQSRCQTAVSHACGLIRARPTAAPARACRTAPPITPRANASCRELPAGPGSSMPHYPRLWGRSRLQSDGLFGTAFAAAQPQPRTELAVRRSGAVTRGSSNSPVREVPTREHADPTSPRARAKKWVW